MRKDNESKANSPKEPHQILLWGVLVGLLIACGTVAAAIVREDRPQTASTAKLRDQAPVLATKKKTTAPHLPKPSLSPFDRYLIGLVNEKGGRFAVSYREGLDLMQQVMNKIPPSELADRVHLYMTIGGWDHTSTSEALSRLNRLYLGKYLVLEGDVFRIQADRDYPLSGLNQFTAFGEVRMLSNSYIPINVICRSRQPIPPLLLAPMLTQIVGFETGRNAGGESIIMPVVSVVAIEGGLPDQSSKMLFFIN